MAGMLTKRAVSATLWKNWRPRYIVLRPGWVEWHKWIVDEDARADLPAGKMHFHHTSVASAGGDRAHCLTISTAGPVLRLDPILYDPPPAQTPSLSPDLPDCWPHNPNATRNLQAACCSSRAGTMPRGTRG